MHLFQRSFRPPPPGRRPFVVRHLAPTLTLGLLLVGLAWADGLVADLPAPGALITRASPNTTKIYDRSGRLLFEVLDPRAGRRTRLALADVPPHFRDAVIAVEDANFYQHPGVDAGGVLRALVQAAQQGELVSGGSTITQQLARELLLAKEERESRTLTRKLREIVLALRITQAYSKDSILEMYLNEVYFGNMAYGAEAAARTYFGKGARELDLAESALLAGLIQSPAAYNPLVNLDAARQRQQVVLNLMMKKGFASESEVQLARAEALHFVGQDPTGSQNSPGLPAPHFVTYVRNLLEAEYGAAAVNDGGMSVVTTLDLDLQQRAEAIVRAHLDALAQQTRHGSAPDFNVHDGALVAIQPGTGDILAMVGSADYFDKKIDGAVNVAMANRQPGSAIKAITYATALARDYTAATVLSDVPTAFTTREGLPYQPQNYDHTWHGPMSLRQALATSNNMIAVKVLDHVGIDAMIATAQSLGISTFGDDRRFGLSLTLGGGEVSLLELTGAYATFANAGDWVAPRAILAVTTGDAKSRTARPVLHHPSSVSAPVAYLITSILSDDGARIGAFGEDSVLKLSRPAAAKTGTTTDWRDNWTLGYTPDLAVGVWVGNADNTPMYQVSGITGAGPIWHDFMEAAHAGRPARDFARPIGILEADICETSGLLATNLCPRQRREVFIAGTEPIRADDSYVALSLDSTTGLLWADDCAGQRLTKVFRVLPLEAQQWGRENGFEAMPQYDCRDQIADNVLQPAASGGASLLVTSPAPNTTFALTPYLPSEAQQIEIGARQTTPVLVRELRLLVDGQALATFTEPPYRALWPLQVGEHTVQAVGMDAKGRPVESALVRFTVQ